MRLGQTYKLRYTIYKNVRVEQWRRGVVYCNIEKHIVLGQEATID